MTSRRQWNLGLMCRPGKALSSLCHWSWSHLRKKQQVQMFCFMFVCFSFAFVFEAKGWSCSPVASHLCPCVTCGAEELLSMFARVILLFVSSLVSSHRDISHTRLTSSHQRVDSVTCVIVVLLPTVSLYCFLWGGVESERHILLSVLIEIQFILVPRFMHITYMFSPSAKSCPIIVLIFLALISLFVR